MASTQEIHHTPIEGQDFNIQSGHCFQPTNPEISTHKPHKKCVACEPVWKHKPLKKWNKHKLNKDECSSSSSSDSYLDISSSDSCLSSSSSECDFGADSSELKPICKHKPPKECHFPAKCFESKHKLKKEKDNFVPGKKSNFGDWKHKSKHFECEQQCTGCLECKFKPKKTGVCTGSIQNCLVCEGPVCPTNECVHCVGDVHKWFDCEDRFRRCLICKQEFSNLPCECLENSHFGLYALRIFLIRRCRFFGCHRLWAKPASKPGPNPCPCQTPQPTKF